MTAIQQNLHSTVVLLKENGNYTAPYPTLYLHSTVVLLKDGQPIQTHHKEKYLHSTVVLLKEKIYIKKE